MELGKQRLGARFNADSETDLAFDRYQRVVHRLRHHLVLAGLLRAVGDAEVELQGCRAEVARSEAAPDNDDKLVRLAETWPRRERADELEIELEDCCEAFFLVLQTNLTALESAARGVFEAAEKRDRLPLIAPGSASLRLRDESQIWQIYQVANYVKHRDQWPTEDANKRKPTIDVLLALNVIDDASDPVRNPTCRLTAACARAIAPRAVASSTHDALQQLQWQCVAFGQSGEWTIQAQFDPHEAALDKIRSARAQSQEQKAAAALVEEGGRRARDSGEHEDS